MGFGGRGGGEGGREGRRAERVDWSSLARAVVEGKRAAQRASGAARRGLPRTRGSSVMPIFAPGWKFPSLSRGHCSGNVSEGVALHSAPRYSHSDAPACTCTVSAASGGKAAFAGYKRG